MARLDAAQTAPEVAEAPCLAPSGVRGLPQGRQQTARGRMTDETFTIKRRDTLFLPECLPDPATVDPTGARVRFRFRRNPAEHCFDQIASICVFNGLFLERPRILIVMHHHLQPTRSPYTSSAICRRRSNE
jgi:hypothetical protein